MATKVRASFFLVAAAYASVLFTAPARAENFPKIENSEFDAAIKITGLVSSEVPFLGTTKFWRIRSFIDKKTLRPSHQIYVELGYSGSWRFYESASDDQATPLHVTSLNRDVLSCLSSCRYSEIVAIDLSDKKLRENPGGFRVKLAARNGDAEILAISPGQIGPQLQAIASVSGGAPAGPAVAPNAAPVAKSASPSNPGTTFAPVPKIVNPGPHLGLKVVPIKAALAEEIKQPEGVGMYVGVVEPGTPAEEAGLQVGDIIMTMAGRNVNDYADANAALAKNKGRKSLSLKVRRNGQDYDSLVKFH